MTDEEIALNLTKIINDNINENSNHYLNEKGVMETYKRVLEENSDMDTFQIIHFLENIYNSVSREFGEQKEKNRMNYDITFCSNTNCKQKCERNQINVDKKEVLIWISNFKECKCFRKKGDKQ